MQKRADTTKAAFPKEDAAFLMRSTEYAGYLTGVLHILTPRHLQALDPQTGSLSISLDMDEFDFELAFQQTSFYVETPSGRLRLRIEETNQQFDRFLQEHEVTNWAYITAYNPQSQLLTEEENLIRQQALKDLLTRTNYRTLDGEGVGDDRRWPPEPSFLVLEIPRSKAVTLGEQFDQKAIVVGVRGGAPELVFMVIQEDRNDE